MRTFGIHSRARIAITTSFVINGATVGAFYARIPDFKEELGVSNSALGFALLCIALGVLIGIGFSGRQSAKSGSATVVYWATYALGFSRSLKVIGLLGVETPYGWNLIRSLKKGITFP